MSRAVIHDPKDALGGLVGFAAHHLRDEAVRGSNPIFLYAVSEELGAMEVPSRQIGPSALPEILVLDSHGSAGGDCQGGLLTAARLNAGFFIRGDSLVNKGKVDSKTVQGILRHIDICTTMNDREEKQGAQGAFLGAVGLGSRLVQ